MWLSKFIKNAILLVIGSSLVFFTVISESWSQEFHILSTQVQEFAVKNLIFSKIEQDHPDIKGLEKSLFYIDVLTFADVIAIKRKEIIGKKTVTPEPEDYNLSFSIICFLPFGPIHDENKKKIIPIRPKLVQDCFINSGKRQQIRNSINEKLIRLDKNQLIKEGKSMFDIIDVEKINRR